LEGQFESSVTINSLAVNIQLLIVIVFYLKSVENVKSEEGLWNLQYNVLVLVAFIAAGDGDWQGRLI